MLANVHERTASTGASRCCDGLPVTLKGAVAIELLEKLALCV